MRLIDADELREYWLYNGLNERIYDTNDVLESIDEQPDVDPESLRPTAHWISVKDRLPEKDEYVLCFCNIGDGFQAIFHYGKERKFDGTAVTHWMPLPEPPEVTP